MSHNIERRLGNQLQGTRCRAHGKDRAVRVGDQNLFLPDVSVSCRDADGSFARDPIIAVEVLSPSTETVTGVRSYGATRSSPAFAITCWSPRPSRWSSSTAARNRAGPMSA